MVNCDDLNSRVEKFEELLCNVFGDVVSEVETGFELGVLKRIITSLKRTIVDLQRYISSNIYGKENYLGKVEFREIDRKRKIELDSANNGEFRIDGVGFRKEMEGFEKMLGNILAEHYSYKNEKELSVKSLMNSLSSLYDNLVKMEMEILNLKMENFGQKVEKDFCFDRWAI